MDDDAARFDPNHAIALFNISKEKARKYMQDGHYMEALHMFELTLSFKLPDTLKSVIHLEIAKLLVILKNYQGAREAAFISINFEPSFEALKLMFDIILKLEGPNVALSNWLHFYREYTSNEEISIYSLHEIVVLIVNYKDQLNKHILQSISKPPKLQLEKVLVELSERDHWLAIAHLVLGLFPNGSVLPGAAKNCRTTGISVAKLLIQYEDKVKYWVDSLAAAFIEGGSLVEELRLICNQPPLHTAAEIAVKSGFFQLYTVVAKLSHQNGSLDAKNREGFTVTKYLEKKGYQSNTNYKNIMEINQQIRGKPEADEQNQEGMLRENAKTAIAQHRYDEALHCYSQILNILDEANVAGRAKYFRNISLVYSYQKKYDKSLEFAEKCLSIFPSFGKAYWRKAQVLQVLNRPHLACHTYLTGLAYSEDPVEFLSQAVKQLENNIQQKKYDFKECLPLFQKVERDLWSKFLVQASKDAKWTSIKLVVIGPLNGVPLANDFDASQISLSTLFDTLKSEEYLRKPCHMMLLKLLKQGAEIQTLSQNPDEIFHILVKLVLLTQSCDVLEYVLKRNPLTPTKENEMLLHTAVKHGNVSSELCFRVVHLLLQKGINPNATDNSGKKALDYITEKFTMTGALLQIYTPNLELDSNSLKEIGNKYFKNKKYEIACSYYTVGIVVLGRQKENSDLSAHLHGNRCECYIKMKEFDYANKDASIAAEMRPDWYKVHYRLSKIYRHENVALAYVTLYKAYSLLEVDHENPVRQDIVRELCCMKIEENHINFIDMNFDDLLIASANFMKNKEYILAKYIFIYFLKDCLMPWKINENVINISCLCSEEAILAGTDVFQEALIGFLASGADLRNLSIYKGDTYLHAASIMASRYGYGQLLMYILEKRTMRLSEINLIDSSGKTALYRILNEPHTFFKERVIRVLMEFGAQSKYFPKDFPPEKILSKNDYLTINDLGQTSSNKKKTKFEQKNSSKSQSTTKSSSSVPKADAASKPLDPCTECQKIYNNALEKQKSGAGVKICESLVYLCQLNHKGKLHEQWVSKSVDLIVDQLEHSDMLAIPACLLSLKASPFLKIVQKLASAKKWLCMHQAFESYRQKYDGRYLENFAISMTVADFLNSINFKENDTYGKVLTCLITNGATIGKDPHLNKTALEVCIENGIYRAILILLKNGLDPSLLTLSPGDTPLHAAAEIALRKDVGYFELFEYLLKLHDSDPMKYSYLDMSCVDKSQQTLFHVACRIKYSKNSLKLVQILHKRGLPSDVPDAAGKIPYQYISQKLSDRRNSYLVHSSSEIVPTKSESSSRSSTPESGNNTDPSKNAKPQIEMVKIERKMNKEIMKASLKEKIDSVPYHKCRELHILSFDKESKNVDNRRTYGLKEDAQSTEDLEDLSENETEESQEIDILNSNAFEKLEWEVECTSNVWKTLHDKNLPYKRRKQAVYKIQQLASGNWHRTCYKKVKNVPQTLKLFTIKLSRTSRIVWELAIAFSPRCSDMKRVLDGNSGLESGQIYSEVIRVWAVVFDMKNLKHVEAQIVKSHERGESCLVQKQLESVNDGQDYFRGDTKRLPRLFAESQLDKNQLDLQHFCPPASDRDDEYHIIKFYSFSTAIVFSMLQMDQSRNVDFPFQVTELEYRIINLSSKAPIILLGRSGTGKTTCCLYRLWMNFVNYWSKVKLTEDPIYPNNFVEMRQPEDCEQHERDEDEKKAEHQATENEANLDTAGCSDVNRNRPAFVNLRQLFVTKNSVLCSEVLKNFRELCHGSELTNKYMGVEEPTLPPTFQEITDQHFPLFLTSKKLWLILDASLNPPYFFPRNADSSLKSKVMGWSDEEDHLAFLPNLDDENEDGSFALPYDFLAQQNKATYQRREVTYEIFLQLWPEINKPASGYHPSLVWTEIISFIKGSFEALNTKNGYLSEEQYISIGRKRAPNFTGERDKVYQLFWKYHQKKRQKKMFDECDVVFNLCKRLQEETHFPCPLHEIYVDETQDFTQAELCLLIQLSENPNQMFLTGDTAQNIMRGVSFRFSDLKSLFYYAKEQSASSKRSQVIHCPKSLYKLPHNYRSHQGILKLASSVIDILFRYFSDSFDPMQKDQGLFDGPKPKLLEFCSLENLAMLLRRNKQQTSDIEFGAHQAILVVNNESREKLPEVLSTGLVLTIFEAKGLEFDDVLLYNFFQDSQASKEWRVVTEFLQELVKSQTKDQSNNQENLLEIDMDVLQEANRPRPLAFDSNIHKILNSELKLLYTALTRARVNLWIFDADDTKRAPMFDYFKTLKLVQPINTDNLEEEMIFAEGSTQEMWLRRGDDFSRRSLFEIAAKCYHRGGYVQQEKTALANHQALTAQRCPDLHKKKEHFLQAAQLYIDCDQHIKAAKCLGHAKEKLFSTELFEKCQEYDIAGRNYLSLEMPHKASHCYEILQQFDKTVDILHDNKMYDHAIDAIQRYNNLVESYDKKGEEVPEILLNHKPQKDINYLCYQSANSHYKNRNFDQMKSVLHQLPSAEKMEFLEKNGLINLAADMLFEEGLLEQSIQLLRRNGKYEKCIELARSGTDEMLANCLYTFAQYKYVQLKQLDEDSDLSALKDETTLLLEEAKACYQRKADVNGYGLCLLLLSMMNKDKESAAEALTKFLLISPRPNVAGCLQSAEVLIEFLQFDENSYSANIMKTIQLSYKILKDLKSTVYTVNLPMREYLQHFGFHVLNSQTVCTYPKLEPLVSIQFESTSSTISDSQIDYPIAEIKQKLHCHLLSVIEKLFLWVRQCYMLQLSQNIQCPLYLAGHNCQGVEECLCPLQKIGILCKTSTSSCLHRHAPYTENVFHIAMLVTKNLMLMDSDLIEQVDEDLALMTTVKSLFDEKNFYSVSQILLQLLTPIAGNNLPFKNPAQYGSMKKWFLSLRKCGVFVRNYLFATWKRVRFRRQLPNFFLECRILIGLFNLNVNLRVWMNKLCEYQSAKKFRSQKNGVLIFSNNMYFCIYERFVDSLFYLHEKWDPFESLIKFTKYTTLLMRDDIKDFPRLDILLFWCEFFVTLALMLILKSNKDLGVALPGSYVTQSFFIDCLNRYSEFSLQKSIQQIRPLHPVKVKTLMDRITKLVGLMFQSNIINIAAEQQHTISGVTERYIILGLVFMCNCDRGVDKSLAPMICHIISNITITDMMAPRLQHALEKLRIAKGALDTILILHELLQKRGDSVGQYYWSYNPQTQQGMQCQFRDPCPTKTFTSLEFDSKGIDERQYDNTGEYDIDDETDECGFTETEQDQVRQFSEKMKAVSIISRAYLTYKFRCACSQLAYKLSKYIDVELEMDYFSDIKLSEAGCNICGNSFATVLASEMLLDASMTGKELTDNTGEDTPKKSKMAQHKEKSDHVSKEIQFRRCIKKYRQEFIPVVKKTHELLAAYEQKDLNEELKYHFKRLNNCVNELDQMTIIMCKEASWNNLPFQKLVELKCNLVTTDGKVSKTRIAIVAQDKVLPEVSEVDEADDLVDAQDIVQEPRQIQTKIFYKHKNKKN